MNVLLVATIAILRLLAITLMDHLLVLVTLDTVAQGRIVKVGIFLLGDFALKSIYKIVFFLDMHDQPLS